jgi:hypothetical protein
VAYVQAMDWILEHTHLYPQLEAPLWKLPVQAESVFWLVVLTAPKVVGSVPLLQAVSKDALVVESAVLTQTELPYVRLVETVLLPRLLAHALIPNIT